MPDQPWPPAPVALASADALVGIDDTDNDSSPGTGYLAQRLLEALAAEGLAAPCGATRHQLLVDPRVPYTSHNSSACLAIATRSGVGLDAVDAAAARFLGEHAAAGSDPGLAVVSRHLADGHRDAAVAFGRLAKTDLLDQTTARSVAAAHGILLSGHGGTETALSEHWPPLACTCPGPTASSCGWTAYARCDQAGTPSVTCCARCRLTTPARRTANAPARGRPSRSRHGYARCSSTAGPSSCSSMSSLGGTSHRGGRPHVTWSGSTERRPASNRTARRPKPVARHRGRRTGGRRGLRIVVSVIVVIRAPLVSIVRVP
jgi:hypothetical protein